MASEKGALKSSWKRGRRTSEGRWSRSAVESCKSGRDAIVIPVGVNVYVFCRTFRLSSLFFLLCGLFVHFPRL